MGSKTLKNGDFGVFGVQKMVKNESKMGQKMTRFLARFYVFGNLKHVLRNVYFMLFGYRAWVTDP